MNLLRLIRLLSAQETDANFGDATVVSSALVPEPSDEIRRRQLALLERHVVISRLHRAWPSTARPGSYD